ncbi:MAG: hypothetical protein ACE5KM_15865 [Planctomycetaceae bacterium]
MSSYSRVVHRAIRDVQLTAYPQFLLRALVEELEVGPGSRLLIAGAVTAPLKPFFVGLGIDVADVSAPPVDFDAQRRVSSGTAAMSACPMDRPCFDAVLLAGFSGYQASLFERSALHTTANLLTMVRGGGRFVVLSPDRDDMPHSRPCFERHLRFFHGKVDSMRHPSRFRRLISSFESGPARWDRWTCTLSLSSVPRWPGDWLECADRAADAKLPSCCVKAGVAAAPIVGEAA